jgi:Trk K+ transport system NAD-binding subunit
MILPGDTIIGAIMRDGVISVPGGDAMIQPGDRVLALTLLDHEVEVRRSLRGGDS